MKDASIRALATAAVSLSLPDSTAAQTPPAVASAAVELTLVISSRSERPSTQGLAQNFSGAVRIDPLFQPTGPTRTSGAYVSFEAGARSHWHTHPLGQTLVVTVGTGRVQRGGGPVETIRAGDVVWIPPGVKHWHGAAPDSAMTHIAIQEQQDGRSVDWLEIVSYAQYNAGSDVRTPSTPSQAQRSFGDIAPKLAELTDQVLFGDVWARPGLSPRDRSLVTVSALIAMNHPEQLRAHMARARDNGVSQEELVETLTHLAFYAGWPSAVTAAGVAKEVLSSTR